MAKHDCKSANSVACSSGRLRDGSSSQPAPPAAPPGWGVRQSKSRPHLFYFFDLSNQSKSVWANSKQANDLFAHSQQQHKQQNAHNIEPACSKSTSNSHVPKTNRKRAAAVAVATIYYY